MRAVEGAAGGGVARAVVFQHGAVAVLDLDRAVIGQQLLHPAVECDLGATERRFVARRRRAPPTAAPPSRRARPRPRPRPRRSRARPHRANGNRCGRLPRAGCASAMTRSSAATRLECCASTASTRRSRNRRRSDAGPLNSGSMAGVEPHHAQMIGEGRRRGDRSRGRSGICATSAKSSPAGGSMPVPRVARPSMPSISADTAQAPSPSEKANSSMVARRRPRPGASNEIASIRLVLPAPFGAGEHHQSPRGRKRDLRRRGSCGSWSDVRRRMQGGGHRRALPPCDAASIKPASASAHRARPWRPCPGSASASRGRRA